MRSVKKNILSKDPSHAGESQLKSNLTLSAGERLSALIGVNRLAYDFYLSNADNAKLDPMDLTEDDVKNLLKSLNHHGVKYLLIGGFSANVHGHIYTTLDLDLWIKPGESNTQKLIVALKEIGVAGAERLAGHQFIAGFTQIAFGEKGFTLDLTHRLIAFDDADFDVCHGRAKKARFQGIPFVTLSLEDLIKEKRAGAKKRTKDLLHLEELEKISRQKKSDRGKDKGMDR